MIMIVRRLLVPVPAPHRQRLQNQQRRHLHLRRLLRQCHLQRHEKQQLL